MSIEQLLLLIVTVVLVAVIFYIAGGLVSREWSVGSGYAARLVLMSLIAVIIIPVFMDVAGHIHLGELGLLIAFVLLIFVVRFVIVDELTVTDEWLSSIVISLLGVVLIYIVNVVAREVFDISVFSIF